MSDHPDFTSPPHPLFIKRIAEEFLGGAYYQNEADIQGFIDTVTSPSYFNPMLHQAGQLNDKRTEKRILELGDAEYHVLNAIKTMDKHQLFEAMNSLMSSAVPYHIAIRTLQNVHENTPKDKLPVSTQNSSEIVSRLSALEYLRKSDPSAQLPSLEQAYQIQQDNMYNETYQEIWPKIYEELSKKWRLDSWDAKENLTIILPRDSIPEQYQQHFDDSKSALVEQYQQARTHFDSAAEALWQKLEAVSKTPAIFEQRSKNFLRFAPNEELLKHIFTVPAELPTLPSELDDVRTLEILKKMVETQQYIWQKKREFPSGAEFLELFDPSKADSEFGKYMQLQPESVKKEINGVLRYIKEHPELLEKYRADALIDQFHFIIKDELRQKTEQNPELKKSLDQILPNLRRIFNTPSGDRCFDCDEELRKHYSAMKQAVFAMHGSSVSPASDTSSVTVLPGSSQHRVAAIS